MSLREEDRQKNGCPSRGLGLAAAAIGVGVGAALYYFFSKRPENPSSEGSSSENWHYESPQTLYEDTDISDDSYSTISVNTTTDTSFHDISYSINNISHSSSQMSTVDNEDVTTDDDFNTAMNISSISHTSPSSDDYSLDDELDGADSQFSDSSDGLEIEISMEHFEHPLNSSLSRFLSTGHYVLDSSPNRHDRSRERNWSFEECSICFDVILRDQEVMSLSCTHNFHQACILPWLQQQQTCPNCRKNVLN